MKNSRKVLIISLLFLIISLSSCSSNSSAFVVENISGTMNFKQFEIIYSPADFQCNTLQLYNENDTIKQKFYNNKYELDSNIVINSETISNLCSSHNVKSMDDIYLLYGQPVWTNDNFLIFDSWPLKQDLFYIFNLSNDKKITLVKENADEILLFGKEKDGVIQLYTDYKIYTIKDDKIEYSEYRFNTEFARYIDLSGYDYVETDVFRYNYSEAFCIYVVNAYMFNENTIESTISFFNFGSINNDNWQIEELHNKVILDFYLENESFYIIISEQEESSQINILKYKYSNDNIWTLEYSIPIDLSIEVKHLQNNCVSVSDEYIIYYPYNTDNSKINIFVIEKDTYTITFSCSLKTEDIGIIREILVE